MKTTLNSLALFGGTPAFAEKLHVGRPNIGDRERLHQRLDEILDRNWLTNNGPCVQEFEARLAALADTAHCIAVCNATVALEMLVRAANLSGEVIVPSFTFVATVHALQTAGVTPVFCDIDPATHSLDPKLVESLITPRTSGILGVHLWGNACAVDLLTEIASRHRLALLFDAAHALGCTHEGKPIGGFGAAEVFSFHATKFVNTFEGGAITTNDVGLAERLRLARNFGFADYDKVVSPGTNGKMSEISAAMGLTSLESMEKFVATNMSNYRSYRRALSGIPGLSLFTYNEAERCNYQYVILVLDEAAAGISRDFLVKALQAENIIARRYFYPGCHRMEPYQTLFPNAGAHLPATEDLSRRVLALPTGTAVGDEQIKVIGELIRFIVAHGREMQTRTA